MEVLYKFSALKTLMKFFMFRNKKRRFKWSMRAVIGRFGNKKNSFLFCFFRKKKDGNVYLFPYNDDWLKKQHFFVFRLPSQKKRYPKHIKLRMQSGREKISGFVGMWWWSLRWFLNLWRFEKNVYEK